MGSTFVSLNFHIVWSTKHRRPLISDDWIVRLHQYIGGTVRGLAGQPLRVGGVADHVHLLVGLKATHKLCDLVREVKKASSGWVHDTIGFERFAWQEGYSAFTVSPTACDSVGGYIERQPEHHQRKTYLEELTELLEKARIEYDAKFLE